jgi:hypothetical protein
LFKLLQEVITPDLGVSIAAGYSWRIAGKNEPLVRRTLRVR